MPKTPPNHEFLDHCLELLHPLTPLGALRAKRMFGGHGVYLDDVFFAIVTGERLYLKVDADTRDRFIAAGGSPFVYQREGQQVSLNYHAPPDEAMESPQLMQPWARLALDAALRARAAKPSSAARKRPAAAPAKRARPRRAKAKPAAA